ncbi:hypothetical protein F2P45_32885 [Massilia sp. CCM 8733]|uniref:Uncharacterized protein n=1 Tax=Massilia mucilaginosa TaxID=2609282 RepID=A0ABX0P395_9BURK|nr:hypothetical protein [Massilia mucilaginosa]NHZ93760.1 hypothetical protein [Massilia mucilaginosa]
MSYVLIAMACEWVDAPNGMCNDFWTAEIRDGSLYLQDRNTDSIALRFDPFAHTITVTNGTVGGAGSVRTDVFKLDPSPAYDQALTRRMKRAHWSARGTWSPAIAKKWTYSRAKIEFGAK